MKGAINEELNGNSTNVIEVSFSNQSEENLSQNSSDVLDDDPLEDLMNEFIDDDIDDHPKLQDYIFHHQESWDYKISMADSVGDISDVLLKQTKRLREDVKD